ncbi:MAG: hypothetical protein U0269_19420 [Polyangiales bacterium]
MDKSAALTVSLAVVTAVAAAVAIVPPGADTARGLRVEHMSGWSSGRPLLLRVTVEDGGSRSWRAPSTATIRARAGSRSETVTARRAGTGPWLLAVIDALDGPVTLAVEAEGLRAESVVRPQPPSRETRLSDTGRARADVAVDGYILTPEVGGAAILSAGVENASKTVEIRGDDPSLAIGPERITLDACGMSTLYARAAGLAAPFVATIDGVERRFRLPLVPGAVTTRVEEQSITVAHALGGVTAYVLTGDARGPRRWLAVALDTATDRAATARVELRPDEQWAIASSSSDFERVSGAWRITPPGLTPCALTPLGAYFARIAAPTPPVPAIAIAYDGAARSVDARDARRERTRRIALWITAAALGALSALMLAASRTRSEALDREGLTKGSGAHRVAAYGIVALAVLAFAIAVAVQLRA